MSLFGRSLKIMFSLLHQVMKSDEKFQGTYNEQDAIEAYT